MKKLLRAGLLVIGAVVVVPLLTLRVTGLEPRYVDPASEAFADSGRTAWPGLWLKGEVVREPVTNWDWVREVNDPVRGNSIMLETRTWYGIPHSVTIGLTPRGDRLYIRGSEQGSRLDKGFPDSKAWWANVIRDPRVRMKIDGKIYEMTVVLIANRAEVAELMGRDPIRREIGPDGIEQVVEVVHYFRVFQRNVPEHGSESTLRVEAQAPHAPFMMQRIYTGTDGLSHVENIELNEQSVMEEVTGMSVRVSQPGSFADWHVGPGRRYIINLTGGGQLGVAEGEVDLPAGSIEYIDDLTGQGHTTANVGDAPRMSIHLEFADQNQVIGPIGNTR